jgi:hypothetical protein
MAPEKNNAKSMPKIIENPIINASSRLNLNLILFVFHLLMKSIFPKTFQFV